MSENWNTMKWIEMDVGGFVLHIFLILADQNRAAHIGLRFASCMNLFFAAGVPHWKIQSIWQQRQTRSSQSFQHSRPLACEGH